MSKKYGWMRWGGGQAHGPFDSYELALADAQTYICDDNETLDITINELMDVNGDDFVNYLCNITEDLLCQASESFDDSHGNGDEHMFEICTDFKEAEKDLKNLLKQWASKWVCTTSNWWLEEGDKITITGNRNENQ